MIFEDTETCGRHGPVVLIQWARDEGEINLHSVWKEPVIKTLELIEEIYDEPDGMVGFNLAFECFHFSKLYTTLKLLKNIHNPPEILDYALAEPEARNGLCLKPQTALDIMLHARKGPYQSLMDRSDVRIKKVPTAIAWQLAVELTNRIPIKDVYFSRRTDARVRWQVRDILDSFDEPIPDFKDVVLKFAPSSALKALATDALGLKEVLFFKDVELPRKAYPTETGYAPFALAEGKPGKWNNSWPDKIRQHISHWEYSSLARKYASDDVKYTRDLYHYFDDPEPGDDDSILACMVGAVRWHGFAIDVDGITDLRAKALADEKKIRDKFNYNSPDICRRYMTQVMDETEQLVMHVNDKFTTKAIILEEVSKWKIESVCEKCGGQGCHDCNDGLVQTDVPHEAAVRATEILDARHAKKEIELYDKLLLAGRFHASFKVIGALSSRMSGSDGLNAQGVKRTTEVRQCFPLAFPGMQLDGGDFAGFEVTLLDATYHDPKLHEELQSGKKIHGIWGSRYFFPDMSYDEILATKGRAGEKDKYTRSKNGVFAIAYFGEGYTLHNRVGIPEATAEEAFHNILQDYKEFAERRKFVTDMFCSMRQPNGIGTAVEWHEPEEHIATMLGFRRYFTLENQICKALFQLGENPPEAWKAINVKVVRRDRLQTSCNATRSALFAAAFAQQASNMRAAGNHIIQGTGAQINKRLQRKIWSVQPRGIAAWRVLPLNVHDEIMAPVLPQYSQAVGKIVEDYVEEMKATVPLIEIEWSQKLKSWADK